MSGSSRCTLVGSSLSFEMMRCSRAVFVGVASRVSPRRATHFLLLRQEKVSKEKASRMRRPATPVRCVARVSRGLAKLAALKQRQPLPVCRCATRLRITAVSAEDRIQQESAKALSCAAVGGSRRVAGLALFERSEFSPTPPDASSARYRAAALTSARLFFGDFLLAKQKKVTALSGARPDTATRVTDLAITTNPSC
jgi:hypothetical protein